ncbi:hypothetical protein ACFQY4_24000 [Catellatospora bangladeshensis]
MTIDALDPRSKIPEYKVCACRIEAAAEITPVPPPPMPPGRESYAEAQRARAERLPPTSSQGRGTSQP